MPNDRTAPQAAPASLMMSAAGPEGSDASRLALLGHDLRAAVSDIIGGLRLIDAGRLDDAPRLQLERVRAASEVLARLLEDALAPMIDEGGTTGNAPASLPLARLLRDVELRWSGRAREKGVGFVMALAPDLPRVVRLDRIALERILSNLISNAVKYTDSGEIRVSLALAPDAALVFRVEDDGPGFPDAGQASHHPPRAGSGLGLKIAQEMATRLGGTLATGNRPAGGALVTLTIPQTAWQPPTGPAEAEPGAAALPDLRGLKILVAEDSETNQLLMRHMLAALGAEAEMASDGVEALGRLDREGFDAALIDIEMPRLSGIEVMRAIRSGGGRHADIPIMAVTAYVLRANREAIYAAGADSILAKPLGGLEAFGAAMATLFDRSRPAEPHPAQPREPRALDTGRFEALLEMAGPESRAELLTRLLSDLRSVERGLVLGCSEPDHALIRSQTHVLIAVAGAVGAERLMKSAESLNAAGRTRDADAVKAVAPETLALLDDLIHFVSGHVPPHSEAR